MQSVEEATQTLAHPVERITDAVGGPARAKVILLLACVLAVNAADFGTVGAVASQLEASLHLSNTKLGLLVAVPALAAAVATLPVGWATDRFRRLPLLTGSLVLWAAAMVASGASTSFAMLLATRVFLGAVQATSGPTLFSLVGDFFPARDRGRVWGYIVTGELLGTGFGFVVSGGVAGLLNWRFAFWALAIPTLLLAVLIRRMLPEPARGGQSRLEPGDQRVRAAEETVRGRDDSRPERDDSLAERVVRRSEVEPDPDLILDEDPSRMPIWRALRYVLRIRTNTIVIVASALGYFFLGGVETFALVFVRGRYGLGQTAATGALALLGVGAVAGSLLGGRLADRRLARGHISARVAVAAAGYIVAALVFVPPLLSSSLAFALPLYIVATGALTTAEPPLDAVRLDVVPAALWGRAEGIRTTLRTVALGGAPILFGFLADHLGATPGGIAAARGGAQSVSRASARGIGYSFLIMLVPLALNGLLLLLARRSYPRDIATAIGSDERSI